MIETASYKSARTATLYTRTSDFLMRHGCDPSALVEDVLGSVLQLAPVVKSLVVRTLRGPNFTGIGRDVDDRYSRRARDLTHARRISIGIEPDPKGSIYKK